MIYQGEIITACDPDLGDMYACEVVRGDEENKRHLLCRVLYMIKYPIQHAILDGSVPNENPPIAEGAICRLKFVGRHTALHTSSRPSYADTYDRCLAEYRRSRQYLYNSLRGVPEALRRIPCPHEEEFEILRRHEDRQYNTQRAVIAH